MQSNRSIGYSPEIVIDDIIDNSITAKAGKVKLSFFPIYEAYVCILDGGVGTNDEERDFAMQYGSKNLTAGREVSDLGCYGLGQKLPLFLSTGC